MEWRPHPPLLAAAVMSATVLCLASQTPAPASARVVLHVIVAASQEEAERLVARLNKGEPFSDVAKAESIDESAPKGGLLGDVAVSDLRADMKAAIEHLSPGDISAVVPLPTGYAIFAVDLPIGSDPERQVPVGRALSARGTIKYVYNVGGLPEADAALDQFAKPADWNRDPRAICQARRQSLTATKAALERFIDPDLNTDAAARSPRNRLQAHLALAGLHAYDGSMRQSLEQYRAAIELAYRDVPDAALPLEEALGIAHLHKAEMDNGSYDSPGDLCLLPAPVGKAFARTSDAEAAIKHFLSYLQRRPDDLEVRWLLNLAYMGIGQYPARVPGGFLIPPSVFSSTESAAPFDDVAPQAGLNLIATAGGVIVDDLLNSGRFDVMTSNFDSCGPMHLRRNKGDGTFEERATQAGLGGELGGLNILQADYNNDGCLDVVVLRGGWQLPQTKSLLRNNCNGTFTNVTDGSGLDTVVTSTQTAVWTDINNDGLLDLFVGNENVRAQLFLNKGNGRFEDIAAAAGVNRLAYTKGVAAGDFDNDGFADLYVSNFTGPNFLYRNNRNNTFTEVAQSAGVTGPGVGFATWFFDYDNDDWPDIFATSYFTSLEEVARTYLNLPNNAAPLKLYRNLGNGTFRDVTETVGLNKVFMPMGANFGDIDNDGYLDVYLGAGNPSYASLMPHVLLRNDRGRSFVDVTAATRTGEIHKGHGIAFADLDNDGDEEIVAEIGGATPGDRHALRLFQNPGHGRDWIALKLVGVKSNRSAIGARIVVRVVNDEGLQTIARTVGSGGSFGASPLEQHIGLGRAAKDVTIDIWWPASDTRQHFEHVAPLQALRVTEFEPSLSRIQRSPTRLGGYQTPR